MEPLIGELDYLTHEVNLRFRELRSGGGGEAEEETKEAHKALQEATWRGADMEGRGGMIFEQLTFGCTRGDRNLTLA